MNTQSNKHKNLPLKSRILNSDALNNKLLQKYQQNIINSAEIEISKIEKEVEDLEQS